MVAVKKKRDETDQSLFSRFRHLIREDDLIHEVKRRERHMRRSEALKQKKKHKQQKDARQRKRNRMRARS